jgi:hypothetical protein
VRFEVLTAAIMKVAVFWVVAPCSLLEFTDVSEVLAATRLYGATTQKKPSLVVLLL